MTARKASGDSGQLIAVKRHGAPGYRQGCHCVICTAGERARKRGEEPPPVAAAVGATDGRRRQGSIERSTRALIRSMGLEGTPAQKLLVAQAVAGARALDDALAAGRPLSAAQRMHERAVKALEASIPPPPAEPVGEDGEDDVLVWVATLHHPTIECQPDYPAVTPGECAACDVAPGARASYGLKHPEEPGHSYGMNRADCGCPECLAGLAMAEQGGG